MHAGLVGRCAWQGLTCLGWVFSVLHASFTSRGSLIKAFRLTCGRGWTQTVLHDRSKHKGGCMVWGCSPCLRAEQWSKAGLRSPVPAPGAQGSKRMQAPRGSCHFSLFF